MNFCFSLSTQAQEPLPNFCRSPESQGVIEVFIRVFVVSLLLGGSHTLMPMFLSCSSEKRRSDSGNSGSDGMDVVGTPLLQSWQYVIRLWWWQYYS